MVSEWERVDDSAFFSNVRVTDPDPVLTLYQKYRLWCKTHPACTAVNEMLGLPCAPAPETTKGGEPSA